jgi:pimeloyl-ACP methyl ester carboxylesterase
VRVGAGTSRSLYPWRGRGTVRDDAAVMASRTASLLVLAALAPAACIEPYDSGESATEQAGSSGSAGPSTGGEGSSGGGTTSDDPTEGGGTGTTTGGDAVPVGGCGAPEYQWLPPDGMGEILAQQFEVELDAATINDLLDVNGYAAFGPVEHGARVYKIRYRTQDRGQAVEATGYVSFPVTMTPQEFPVVLWAHGTTGFSDMCAPTADPQGWQIPLILAAKGYVSVAPDYLGMNGWGAASNMVHPYVVPEPTAIAVLDSARALFEFAKTTPDLPSTPTEKIVLFGASEGGFATLWADRYAPHYAPELDIVANVAAVPPTDAFGLTKHGMTVFGPTTGALAAAIVGGWDWSGRLAPLSEILSSGPPIDVAAMLPQQMKDSCSFGLPDEITQTAQVYVQAMIDAANSGDPESLGMWGCLLERASLGDSEIPLERITPTLIAQGEIDDLVFTPVVREDLPRLCDQGYQIQHVECAGAGHVDAVVQSIPYMIGWVDDRLAGMPLTDVCTINTPVDCTQL